MSFTLLVLKIAVLVLGGVVAATVLRQAPANSRHDVWVLAVVGAAIVPLAGLVLPPLWVIVPARWESLMTPEAQRGVSLLVVIWFGGAAVMLARFIPAWRVLHRIGAEGSLLTGRGVESAFADAARLAGVTRPVRLLTSTTIQVPATWGVRRPVIVLPAQAVDWTRERLRLVLLHELLHVRRQDVLIEYGLRVLGAVYWFHPAVWFAMGQLRLERECACDEAVVATGARASDYCEHLVEIMRAARRTSAGMIVGAAMAAPSTLEHRVLMLLRRSRVPMRSFGGRPLLILGALLVVLVSTLAPCSHFSEDTVARHVSTARR